MGFISYKQQPGLLLTWLMAAIPYKTLGGPTHQLDNWVEIAPGSRVT